jgi:hypothetical protein
MSTREEGKHIPPLRCGFKWHRSLKLDQLLLIASTIQSVLFAPLAWWAHKHPHPPLEVGITHLLQKKQSSMMHAATLVVNTIAGSAAFLNMLIVPTAIVL